MAPIGSIGRTQTTRNQNCESNFIQRYVDKKMDNLLWGNLRNNTTKSNNSKEYTPQRFRKEPTRKEVLEAKESRVNTKWNKVKNFFGGGETMTAKEQIELDLIRKHEQFKKHIEEENLNKPQYIE